MTKSPLWLFNWVLHIMKRELCRLISIIILGLVGCYRMLPNPSCSYNYNLNGPLESPKPYLFRSLIKPHFKTYLDLFVGFYLKNKNNKTLQFSCFFLVNDSITISKMLFLASLGTQSFLQSSYPQLISYSKEQNNHRLSQGGNLPLHIKIYKL